MPPVSRIVIYYFSGTGNAAAVAGWFRAIAESKGTDCELINLSGIDRKNIPAAPKDSMLVFISPTHGFNYPPVMFHFLLRFPRGQANPIVLMNTRAGMKLGPFFLPGLSGMALYFSALILRLKNFRIRAMKSIDLPSNWISLHPGIRKNVVDSIIKRRKEETQKFTGKILEGKKYLRGLISLPLDLAITPVAVLYYLIGRFFLAKTFIASSSCSSCGLCDLSCPVKAIKIVDKRRFWTYKCESCMKCMNICPERAIETAHGFAAIVIFLLNGFVLVELNRITPIRTLLESFMPEPVAGFFHFAMNNIILVFLIFLSYRIMHFLLRYRFFERLFVLTSLTHWKFWRRYRPKWKESR